MLVTGATGYLGRRVVKALRSHDHQVRCLVHIPGREAVFNDPDLDIHYGNVTDPLALRAAIYDVDALIHMVAIIREGKGATFESINHQGTKNVAAAAVQAGTKHYVQVSAIGAQDNPSFPYLRSKWMGEQAVQACGIPYTLLRPSIIFGEGDEFTNALAGLVRAFPIVPIAGTGTNLLQPIAVDDVVECILATVGNEAYMGRTVEIGGPDHLSYSDIVQTVARTMGRKRALMPVPLPVMLGLMRVMEAILPSPPVTTEELRMVVLPNTTDLDSVSHHFGFEPRHFEGNIEFINSITLWEGLRMTAGFMPTRIRGRY